MANSKYLALEMTGQNPSEDVIPLRMLHGQLDYFFPGVLAAKLVPPSYGFNISSIIIHYGLKKGIWGGPRLSLAWQAWQFP